MRYFLGISCALLLGVLNLASATEPPPVLRVDLNADGRPEEISARKSATTEFAEFYQVTVRDSSGTLLWQSPKVTTTDHPFAFGVWEEGDSLPQIAADVDGDGAVELLVPAPRSDVSPTYYRIFRWQKSAFEHVRNRALFASAMNPESFTWITEAPIYGRWIDEFLGTDPAGNFTVRIGEMQEGRYRTGLASVERTSTGFRIVRWINPLTEVGPTESPEQPPATSQPSANMAIVRYLAAITDVDRRSSSGVPLTELKDILAQDRANVHRFGRRQRGDELDSYFTTPAHRELFQRIRVSCPPKLAERIRTGGNVLIFVTVYPDRVEIEEAP